MKFTDALRDRAAARLVLDPADARFAVGSEEERKEARAQWFRQKFIAQVMSSDLEEIPRSRLQPLRGRLLEDSEDGNFYVPRRDGLIDLDYVKNAVAYYCDSTGAPVLLERPGGGLPQTRAELVQEREQRRVNRTHRQVKRR